MKAKVTIDGKEHEITLAEEQIRQVRENWRDEYLKSFTIATESVVLYTRNENRIMFESLFPQSTEIVNKVCLKLYLLARMTQFELLRNGDWEADWNDYMQMLTQDKEYNHFVFGIAVKSREIAKEMLGLFDKDIIKYYN